MQQSVSRHQVIHLINCPFFSTPRTSCHTHNGPSMVLILRQILIPYLSNPHSYNSPTCTCIFHVSLLLRFSTIALHMFSTVLIHGTCSTPLNLPNLWKSVNNEALYYIPYFLLHKKRFLLQKAQRQIPLTIFPPLPQILFPIIFL